MEREGRDPLVDVTEKAINELMIAMAPGGWLVDSIPACQSHSMTADVAVDTADKA